MGFAALHFTTKASPVLALVSRALIEIFGEMTEMFKVIIITFVGLLLAGCAASLTTGGSQIRLVDKQSDYKCKFVGTVAGSNSMGNTTAHDAEGAMNELRNKAAKLGANSVRVINIDSSVLVTTVVGEALICDF